MIWNSTDVELVERSCLPEEDSAFTSWWEARRKQVHAEESTHPRFFNGPSIAVTGIEVDVTGERVSISWVLSDYVNLLTVLATAGDELPAGVERPFWSRCSGMSIVSPLACADGLVWARRSQQVRTGRGRWRCTAAEGSELSDIKTKGWTSAAARGLREEFGIENPTLIGAYLHVGISDEPDLSKNLTHLQWWLPTYTEGSFSEVETSWRSAEDHWENDAVHLGDLPPSAFNYPLPDVVAAALQGR